MSKRIISGLMVASMLIGASQPLVTVHANTTPQSGQSIASSTTSDAIKISTNFNIPAYLNSDLAMTFNISSGNGIKQGDKISLQIPENIDLTKITVNGLDSKYGSLDVNKDSRVVSIVFNGDLNDIQNLNFIVNLFPSAVGTGTVVGTITSDGSTSPITIPNNQYSVSNYDPLNTDNYIITADPGTLTSSGELFDSNYLGSNSYLPNQTNMIYNVRIDPSGKQSTLTGRKVTLTADNRYQSVGSKLDSNQIWISDGPFTSNPSYSKLAESNWQYIVNKDGSITIDVPDGAIYTNYAIVFKVAQTNINKEADAIASATATGNSSGGPVINSQNGILLWGQYQKTNTKGFIPNISVKNPLTIKVGDNIENLKNWLLSQATATDYEDGDISKNITVDSYEQLASAIDKQSLGQYSVNYHVTDSNGNTVSKETTVELQAADPVKAADVTVHYIDADGHKIADDVVLNGNIGDTYETEKKSISGYTFKEIKGNPTGNFTDAAQTVTYVYSKDPVKAADVTVHYIDADGHKIADDVVLNGNIGDTYETEKKSISGYTFKEIKGNPTGNFTDAAQTVTYVYSKDPVKAADVTVHYIDADGHKIADDVVLNGNIGDTYETEKKSISGYTFKEIKGNPTGNFTDAAQTVTYVYSKDPVKAADVITIPVNINTSFDENHATPHNNPLNDAITNDHSSKLPKTAIQSNRQNIIIATILTTLLGAFGLTTYSKKKSKNTEK